MIQLDEIMKDPKIILTFTKHWGYYYHVVKDTANSLNISALYTVLRHLTALTLSEAFTQSKV